jgi:hypothetical protein
MERPITIFEIIEYYELDLTINGVISKVLLFGEAHNQCKYLETGKNTMYPECPPGATTAYDVINKIINKYKNIPNKVGLYLENVLYSTPGYMDSSFYGLARLCQDVYLQTKYNYKKCNVYNVDIRRNKNIIEYDNSNCNINYVETIVNFTESYLKNTCDIYKDEFRSLIEMIKMIMFRFGSVDGLYMTIYKDIIKNCRYRVQLLSYIENYIKNNKLNADKIFLEESGALIDIEFIINNYYDKDYDETIQGTVMFYLCIYNIYLQALMVDLYSAIKIITGPEDIKIFYGGRKHVTNHMDIFKHLHDQKILDLKIIYHCDRDINNNRIHDIIGFNVDF